MSFTFACMNIVVWLGVSLCYLYAKIRTLYVLKHEWSTYNMNDRVHLLIWLWRLKITYFILWYHHLLLFHIWSSSWVKVWNYELVLPAGHKALNSSCGESHVNQFDHIPPCIFKDFQKRVRILLSKKSKYIVFQPWLWVTKEKKKKVGLEVLNFDSHR